VGSVTERTIDTQLTKYLADVHSIEEQALTQLRRAPAIAGDERLAAVFEQHLSETRGQENRIRNRLQAREADASTVKDVAGKLGGLGMVAFAKVNPDTPGKLTAHAYSYEHLEIAAYELLLRVAARAGDAESAEVAHVNLDEERAMAGRLEDCFEIAVAASLRELQPDDLGDQLVKYLVDAHSIEQQSTQLLTKGPDLVDDEGLAAVFRDHLAETERQKSQIAERLDAHDAKPSRFQDAAMRAGALNLGAFFKAQPDTTAKLGGFAFAFEHLEIAAYQLLRRMGERVGDEATVAVANSIADEERTAAARLARLWDQAIEAGLAERGVTSRL
jgi:ferritin-like metal-binding protein YciE